MKRIHASQSSGRHTDRAEIVGRHGHSIVRISVSIDRHYTFQCRATATIIATDGSGNGTVFLSDPYPFDIKNTDPMEYAMRMEKLAQEVLA